MPGDISRSYKGPKDASVPTWMEDDWADRVGIKCHYPDGADQCPGCPHYHRPERYPECTYKTTPA